MRACSGESALSTFYILRFTFDIYPPCTPDDPADRARIALCTTARLTNALTLDDPVRMERAVCKAREVMMVHDGS